MGTRESPIEDEMKRNFPNLLGMQGIMNRDVALQEDFRPFFNLKNKKLSCCVCLLTLRLIVAKHLKDFSSLNFRNAECKGHERIKDMMHY